VGADGLGDGLGRGHDAEGGEDDARAGGDSERMVHVGYS
jgi:hypothetical protein